MLAFCYTMYMMRTVEKQTGDTEMKDKLDTLIEELKEGAELSADGYNALHASTSTHPWCEGKSFEDRKMGILFAVAGRRVNATALYKIQKLKG